MSYFGFLFPTTTWFSANSATWYTWSKCMLLRVQQIQEEQTVSHNCLQQTSKEDPDHKQQNTRFCWLGVFVATWYFTSEKTSLGHPACNLLPTSFSPTACSLTCSAVLQAPSHLSPDFVILWCSQPHSTVAAGRAACPLPYPWAHKPQPVVQSKLNRTDLWHWAHAQSLVSHPPPTRACSIFSPAEHSSCLFQVNPYISPWTTFRSQRTKHATPTESFSGNMVIQELYTTKKSFLHFQYNLQRLFS